MRKISTAAEEIATGMARWDWDGVRIGMGWKAMPDQIEGRGPGAVVGEYRRGSYIVFKGSEQLTWNYQVGYDNFYYLLFYTASILGRAWLT